MKYSLLILLTLVGCKTADDIRREKQVDTLSVQMVQGQRHTGDIKLKITEIEERLNLMYGQIEELQHRTDRRSEEENKERESTVSSMNERLRIAEDKLDKANANIAVLLKQLNSQKKFIGEITKTLKGNKPKKKKRRVSKYSQAMSHFSKKRYSKAVPLFKEFLSQKKINAVKKVKSLHAMGVISYETKKYQDALVYLSKIVTQYPRSSYAPSSLFHIGKSFKALGKAAEANASFDEVVSKYPKSKFVALAKKEKN